MTQGAHFQEPVTELENIHLAFLRYITMLFEYLELIRPICPVTNGLFPGLVLAAWMLLADSAPSTRGVIIIIRVIRGGSRLKTCQRIPPTVPNRVTSISSQTRNGPESTNISDNVCYRELYHTARPESPRVVAHDRLLQRHIVQQHTSNGFTQSQDRGFSRL